MIETYWYISGPKVAMLKGSLSKAYLQDISIKLRTLWLDLEVGASLQSRESLVRDVQHVRKALSSHEGILEFPSLSDNESPVIFSFHGTAARLIDLGAYWVAADGDRSALLLVGSTANAIGGASGRPGEMSPSSDPVGAVRKAFEGSDQRGTFSASLSYAWQRVIATSLEGARARPTIAGFAVFAGIFPADATYMVQIGRDDIRRVVLGSPIYIMQV